MSNIIPPVVDPPAGAAVMLLLRPRAAAQALSISERTLWGLTRRGELPAVRIGRAVRYSAAALQNWIEKKEAAGECGRIRDDLHATI